MSFPACSKVWSILMRRRPGGCQSRPGEVLRTPRRRRRRSHGASYLREDGPVKPDDDNIDNETQLAALLLLSSEFDYHIDTWVAPTKRGTAYRLLRERGLANALASLTSLRYILNESTDVSTGLVLSLLQLQCEGSACGITLWYARYHHVDRVLPNLLTGGT